MIWLALSNCIKDVIKSINSADQFSTIITQLYSLSHYIFQIAQNSVGYTNNYNNGIIQDFNWMCICACLNSSNSEESKVNTNTKCLYKWGRWCRYLRSGNVWIDEVSYRRRRHCRTAGDHSQSVVTFADRNGAGTDFFVVVAGHLANVNLTAITHVGTLNWWKRFIYLVEVSSFVQAILRHLHLSAPSRCCKLHSYALYSFISIHPLSATAVSFGLLWQ